MSSCVCVLGVYVCERDAGESRVVRWAVMRCKAGILTVEGCLGDDGQESESGGLCLGAGAHSCQQEAQHDELLITSS